MCGVGCGKCSGEISDDRRSNEDEEAAQAQMLIHKFNVCVQIMCCVLSLLQPKYGVWVFHPGLIIYHFFPLPYRIAASQVNLLIFI